MQPKSLMNRVYKYAQHATPVDFEASWADVGKTSAHQQDLLVMGPHHCW